MQSMRFDFHIGHNEQVIKHLFHVCFGNSKTVVPRRRGKCFGLLPKTVDRGQQFKTMSPQPWGNNFTNLKALLK